MTTFTRPSLRHQRREKSPPVCRSDGGGALTLRRSKQLKRAAPASLRRPAPMEARQRVRSRAVPVGLPAPNRGEASPLLRRGAGVQPVAALLEAPHDAFAVLDR